MRPGVVLTASRRGTEKVPQTGVDAGVVNCMEVGI